MSSTLKISIPERLWLPIQDAPQDGSLVFLRDYFGNVDLAIWDRGEWNCELGTLTKPVEFARTSIVARN